MHWVFASRLQAGTQTEFDQLGESVAVSMDTGVGFAGASSQSGATGVVFVFDVLAFGSTRTEVQLPAASDGGASQHFGAAVDIDGRYAVVGAPGAKLLGANVGALYLFEQSTGEPDSWLEIGRILASDAVASPIGYGQVAAISDRSTATGRPEYSGSVEGVAYLNDLPEEIFNDGFESGDTVAWSSAP